MTTYEIYTFGIHLSVFIVFTALFTVLIAGIVKLMLKLIRNGIEDASIKKEFLAEKEKTKKQKWIERILSGFTCFLVVLMLLGTILLNIAAIKPTGLIPTIKVVKSSSMSYKYEGNTYLFENNLNNQIELFDIIITQKLPAEEDLNLYDIVVYELDGKMVVHRIVGIEEANANHSERYFICQGDAVERPDKLVVKYSQMYSVYKGQRIPFLGSFVVFMQSPAGWLCIVLMIFATIVTPFIENKIEKERKKRLVLMGLIEEEQKEEEKCLSESA